ncbi:hypothetical protein [Ramlibacter sp. WS9]|uniref:hypothetical protein n=1 Tax=Ramlibacter sp. WS9 TaxID=1882741 RepID=UPI00130537DB|nr:hypothetical protein [Ramlibacter sp. WS9]
MVGGAGSATLMTRRTVGAPITFNGVANVLPINFTNVVTVNGSSVTSNNTLYQRVEGTDVISYGTSFMQPGPAGQGEVKTTYNPPVRDRSASLAVGESQNLVYNEITQLSATATTSNSYTSQITYLGQEATSVPAGSFDACKFQNAMAGTTTTGWTAKGSGVLVRSVNSEGTLQLK